MQINISKRGFTLALFLVSLFISSGSFFIVQGQNRQLSLADILIALRSKKAMIEEKNRILAVAVKERGITFSLTPEIEKELGSTGAYRELLDAIKEKTAPVVAKVITPVKVEIPPVVVSKPPPPPDFDFYRNRATTSFEKGDLNLAVSDLGHAIELRPSDARSYLDRGLTLARQGKYDVSLADFDKSIELDPKSVTYFGRAVSNEKLGNTDKAFTDYQKAADLDAQNEPAKNAISRLIAEKAKTEAKPIIESPKPIVESLMPLSVVSVGPLNSHAARLVTPLYSTLDRKMGNQGKVTVQITLDEQGKAVSVKAVDGPKTLRSASEDAVRKSKFNPVLVDGKAVKSAGYIVFNFIANQ